MTEHSAIYEQTEDGWWVHFPDLPGCTTFGSSREEAERNAREAITAHVELLRDSGRPVPAPSARTAV